MPEHAMASGALCGLDQITAAKPYIAHQPEHRTISYYVAITLNTAPGSYRALRTCQLAAEANTHGVAEEAGSWSTGGRRPTDYTQASQRVGPPRAGGDTLRWAPSSPPFGPAEEDAAAAPPKEAAPAGIACIKDLIT